MTHTKIFKEVLALEAGVQTLSMYGQNPEVVHVDFQAEAVTLWYVADLNAQRLESDFKVVGTGERYNGKVWKHKGTVISASGLFVWHVLQAVKL